MTFSNMYVILTQNLNFKNVIIHNSMLKNTKMLFLETAAEPTFD